LPINDIKWFDLYKYFRENVITVKGAFSHSLKSVGKGMFKNKYWSRSRPKPIPVLVVKKECLCLCSTSSANSNHSSVFSY
jgi:hypothetical protein